MINNGAIEKVVTTLLLLYFNWTICILKLLGYILPLDGSNFDQILQNFAKLFLFKKQVHVLGYNYKIDSSKKQTQKFVNRDLFTFRNIWQLHFKCCDSFFFLLLFEVLYSSRYDIDFVENLAVYCIRYSFHAQLTRVYFGLILFETEPDCQSFVSDLNLAKDKETSLFW